eukprot:scaffold17503_cov62-Attheya_sp.AAC.2
MNKLNHQTMKFFMVDCHPLLLHLVLHLLAYQMNHLLPHLLYHTICQCIIKWKGMIKMNHIHYMTLYENKHEDEDEDMSSSSLSSSERSDQSTCASTPHNIYEDEDIEMGDQDDVTPPPLHLVEARLLQLMMKYSIPLGSYKFFLEWSKSAINTNYDFSSSKKAFGANIKK